MPKYKDGTSENLHRINRHLSVKFDKSLSISDSINYLILYYAEHEDIGDTEINPGIWDVETDINDEDEKESSLT